MSKSEWPTNPAEFIKYMQEHMPKVDRTQNGYEIRTKLLELAQTQAFQPVMAKFGAYQFESKWEADEAIMSFSFPDADEVLEIAEKFNDFVSGKTPTKK